MSDFKLSEQIVLGEIAGKNAAIHAYDKIIWVIRSGYLTLFFAGWALMLQALIENSTQTSETTSYILAMLVVSVGLTVGGFVVDLNYILRKFRVINALNCLTEFAINHESSVNNNEINKELIQLLNVSGDPYPSGRRTAIRAAIIIYMTPFICLVVIWQLGVFLR